MKNRLFALIAFMLFGLFATAQKVEFEEYDLDNGLHVILHQDHSAPVIITSVFYHVGSKDEKPDRTGFAHFFEHLLFEGTENIPRGQWDKIEASNGGSGNATTDFDRTYYYELFPSNNVELALWMESERMMHPIINQIGVDTQNEVVKEEKRYRMDNQPYGKIYPETLKLLFKNHPYRWMPIGSMEDLDAATLEEFQAFHKKYYVPNNATLVVAGDIDKTAVKKMILDYFGPIPKGADINRNFPKEDPITQTIYGKAYDPNIQIPAIIAAYRTPSLKDRDAYVLDMISSYLSDGKSSVLYKKLVDEQKKALEVAAFNYSLEDYGLYALFGIPLGDVGLNDLLAGIDEEIVKVQNELISERDYQKLQNQFENQFVNSISSLSGIASSLARYHVYYNDTNLINNEIDIYRSITREEMRDVAKKYLNPNQRVVLEYLPKKDDQ